jgi:hypothetical protein
MPITALSPKTLNLAGTVGLISLNFDREDE